MGERDAPQASPAGAAVPPPPAALVASYRGARYRLDGAAGLELAIGRSSAALAAWLATQGAAEVTLLTAHNPLSEPCGEAANAAAQAALEARLAALGARWVAASHHDPSGRWPAEPAVAVLDLPAAARAALLAEFVQYAAVVAAGAGPARLAWHPAVVPPAD